MSYSAAEGKEKSLLSGLIKSLEERRSVFPLEYFVGLGFDLKKLLHIQKQLPSICVSLFDPLISSRPWDASQWNVGEQLEKVLGANKWWFRTAGPAWFLFLMRAVHGLHSAIVKLDVRTIPKEVFDHILHHCAEVNLNIVPPPLVLTPEEIDNITKISDYATTLRVKISENSQDVVDLELPVRLVDELESLISEEILVKINQLGVNLGSIKERAQKSGYVKQELFDTQAGPRNYHVWIE